MLDLLEFLKVLVIGIVEGVTEWLPISSTGHMLLLDELLQLKGSAAFKEVFFVVIQLGAILAVAVVFWKRLWPFRRRRDGGSAVKPSVLQTWGKVLLACVPGAAAELLMGSWADAHLSNPWTIAAALIFYGGVILLVERWNKDRVPSVGKMEDIGWRTALLIGLFQVLALVPGTSRSGATIIGALLLGVSRTAAAEFTFTLAIPVMLGMSALKLIKSGLCFSGSELLTLGLAMAVAFLVSLLVIRALLNYIKNHDYRPFGWYRIALGAVILIYFLLK